MKSFNDITRRDFLKTVALAAASATFGCATTEVPRPEQAALPPEPVRTESVVYPPLPGNKIQPPENGCLIGFQKSYVNTKEKSGWALASELARLGESAKDYDELKKLQEPLVKKYEPLFVQNIKNYLKEYASFVGKKPYAYVLVDSVALFGNFPETLGTTLAEEGVVPFIHARVQATNPKFSMNLADIVNGKNDKVLINFSKGAVEFGQKHGSFFFYTMPEPNGNWYYWRHSPNFVPAWRHIWQVFEDQGANQYATWVWIPYCEGVPQASDPEPFYPGDKYVDWIGLSAFSKIGVSGWNLSFDSMITKTYRRMRTDHLQKPLMQGEFGRTNAYDQARWLTSAFKNIRNDFPALKAAIYFGYVEKDDDSHLNEKSMLTLGEIFKDPYWIMAK